MGLRRLRKVLSSGVLLSKLRRGRTRRPGQARALTTSAVATRGRNSRKTRARRRDPSSHTTASDSRRTRNPLAHQSRMGAHHAPAHALAKSAEAIRCNSSRRTPTRKRYPISHTTASDNKHTRRSLEHQSRKDAHHAPAHPERATARVALLGQLRGRRTCLSRTARAPTTNAVALQCNNGGAPQARSRQHPRSRTTAPDSEHTRKLLT